MCCKNVSKKTRRKDVQIKAKREKSELHKTHSSLCSKFYREKNSCSSPTGECPNYWQREGVVDRNKGLLLLLVLLFKKHGKNIINKTFDLKLFFFGDSLKGKNQLYFNFTWTISKLNQLPCHQSTRSELLQFTIIIFPHLCWPFTKPQKRVSITKSTAYVFWTHTLPPSKYQEFGKYTLNFV